MWVIIVFSADSRKTHRREHRRHLRKERFGLCPVAGHHDHEVVRVPDKPVVGESVPTPFRSLHGADRVLVEMLVQHRQRHIGQQR
jgi:hypothetical protein